MYKHAYKPEFKLNPKAASRTKTNANRLDSDINGTFAPSIPSATVILYVRTNPPAIYSLHLLPKLISAFVFSFPLSDDLMSASHANLIWPFPPGWTVAVLATSVFSCVFYLRKSDRKKRRIYGLQHGRLHLNAQVPMWMNMGYWKVRKSSCDLE